MIVDTKLTPVIRNNDGQILNETCFVIFSPLVGELKGDYKICHFHY